MADPTSGPIRAQSADGVTHEFPAGTDPGVIDRVMKDYASRQGPAAAPKVPLGPQPGSAFFGAARLLPEAVQRHLPEFLTGPSVGEQLTAHSQRLAAEEKRLGRPLTINERLHLEHPTESPVAMGFATRELPGEARGLLGSALAGGDEAAIAKLYGRAIEPTSDAAQVNEAVSAILEHSGARPGSVQEFAQAIGRTKQAIADETAALQKQSYVRDVQGRFVPGRRPSDPRLQVLQRQDAAVRGIEGAVLEAAKRAPGGFSMWSLLTSRAPGDLATSIVSLEELVQTVHGAGLEHLATGAAVKALPEFVKWYRGPNRAVKNLFERAAEPEPRGAPLAPVLPPSPAGDRDKLPDLSALDPRLLGMLALGSHQ
jgi:hypothetical protein